MNEVKLPRSLQGAIATTIGWVNPKTGELLKAAKGIPDAIEGYRPNSIKSLEALVEPVIEIDSITEPEPVVEEAPKPKTRKKRTSSKS